MINTLYNSKANIDNNSKIKNYTDLLSSNTLIKGSILKKDGKHIRIQSNEDKNISIVDIVTKNNLTVRQGEMLTIKKSEIETITKISNEQLESEKEREKQEKEELKKEGLKESEENIDALRNLKNSEIPATKENILRFVSIKNNLSNFSQNIDFNSLAILINKGYDIENIPLSDLDGIIKSQLHSTDKSTAAVNNKFNKAISYDEARKRSDDLYKSQMGKDIHDIIISLKQNDIEPTKENVDKVYDIFSKLYNLKDIDNTDIINVLDINENNISIDLLYKIKNYITKSPIAKVSKVYENQEITDITDEKLEKMTPEIEKILEILGIDKTNMDIAKSILKNGKEINVQNINDIKEIRNALSQVQELLDKNIAGMLIKSGIDISNMDIRQLLSEIISVINELENINELSLTEEEMDLSKLLIDAMKEINSNTLLKNISVKAILHSSNVGKDLYDKLFSKISYDSTYSNISLKISTVLNSIENIDFSKIDYSRRNISLQYIAQKHMLFEDNQNTDLKNLEYELNYETNVESQNNIKKHYEYLRMNLRASHISQIIKDRVNPFTSDIRRVSEILQNTTSQDKNLKKLSYMSNENINFISSDILKTQSEFSIKNVKKSFELYNNTNSYFDDLKTIIKEIKEKNFEELNTVSKRIEKLFIKNNYLSKDFLKNDIQNLYESLKEMEKIVSLSNREDKDIFKKYLENISDNIKDSQKISSKNEMIQIPFYMNGESSNANVYAKTKKNKKGKIDPDDMSMLIDLNTKNLGKIGFYIKVENKKLSIKISGSNSSIYNVKSNLKSLDNNLSSLGYDIDFIDLISPENQSKISFIKENVRDTNNKFDLTI